MILQERRDEKDVMCKHYCIDVQVLVVILITLFREEEELSEFVMQSRLRK